MSKSNRLVRGVERLYQMPSDYQGAVDDRRTSEAARLLCLSETGCEILPESADSMVLNLARVAEEYGIGPDDVQKILMTHEPVLALGSKDEQLWTDGS